MVVDLARIQVGMDPSAGFLTVIEEMPGYIHSADKTGHIQVRRRCYHQSVEASLAIITVISFFPFLPFNFLG
jgi:hypothetical protein